MAEIVVPVVGLGLLWIVSNQNNKKEMSNKKEGFSGIKSQKNVLRKQFSPNNFPEDKQKNDEVANNIRKYHNGENATNKYFVKANISQAILTDKDKNKEIKSLTGENVDITRFEHNNMVPFFGARIRQNTDLSKREGILDNFVGTGSQYIKKQSIEPMFKPKKEMHWINGMPNQNDFLQSRVNPSNKISGIKPFQDIKVAPGLNRGYESEGYGGFNAGMASRDDWLPKNVDQLRTLNNKKVTYKGQFLGPKSSVQNLGIHGKVEKQLPDTYYVNSPDKWFTTTGIEKAPRNISKEYLKPEHRTSTTREYFGTGQDSTHSATYSKGVYEESKKQLLASEPVGMATRMNIGDANKADFGRDGYVALPNSRTICNTSDMGNVARGMWATVTPVLDMLRPSRKTNVIGNARPNGNAIGPNQQTLYNRHQKPKSTIKEQSVCNKRTPIGLHKHNGGYATKSHQLKGQQRTSTNHFYIPNGGGESSHAKPRNVDSYSNTRLNNKDTISKSRTNVGNMKLNSNNINMCNRKAPLTRENVFYSPKGISGTPSIACMGANSLKINREKNTGARIGNNLVSALSNNPYAKPFNSVA